jgi:membrane-bound lytic murein transglycosylase MltF
VVNVNATGERKKYLAVVDFFQKYADQYDFDHLMLVAQGYQESKLNQKARSQVGAVGIMQVLPSTAAGHPINLPNVEDVETNIHAGIKYMRFIVDEYFDDQDVDPISKMLFAFASYNAGPNRIARLRRLAPQYDLDPDQWFGNVEWVIARKVGQEPVRYVGNIYKYYLAYRRIRDLEGDPARDGGPE